MILAWLFGPRRKSKGARHKPFSPPRARLRLEALEDRTVPASFVVTRGTGVATDVGSLPWAIVQVNNSTDASNTITFAQTVTTVDLTQALDSINKNVSITGPGAATLTVARDSGPTIPNFTIFTINFGKTVSISDLSITNGSAGAGGGGVDNSGTLTLTNVYLISNHAPSGLGGGVYNETSATLNLAGGRLYFNDAQNGGGLYNSGTANFSYNVSIYQNTATGFGGGVSNSGTLTITDDTEIYNNAASWGGGIKNDGSLSMSGGGSTGTLLLTTGVASTMASSLVRVRRSVMSTSHRTLPTRGVASTYTPVRFRSITAQS
jgi:hypothetical protein